MNAFNVIDAGLYKDRPFYRLGKSPVTMNLSGG